VPTEAASLGYELRDAEDARLLAEGDYARLLATYYPLIVERCQVRLFGRSRARNQKPGAPLDDAYEVAQRVALRLFEELSREKKYSVPFRVVVHKVVEWTTRDYFAEGKSAPVRLGREPPAMNPYREFERDFDLKLLFADLAEQTRRVFELRYRLGFEIDEIAKVLGMTRNSVDQALHRGHNKLREKYWIKKKSRA